MVLIRRKIKIPMVTILIKIKMMISQRGLTLRLIMIVKIIMVNDISTRVKKDLYLKLRKYLLLKFLIFWKRISSNFSFVGPLKYSAKLKVKYPCTNDAYNPPIKR